MKGKLPSLVRRTWDVKSTVYGFGEANKRCGFKQTFKYKVKEGKGRGGKIIHQLRKYDV